MKLNENCKLLPYSYHAQRNKNRSLSLYIRLFVTFLKNIWK